MHVGFSLGTLKVERKRKLPSVRDHRGHLRIRGARMPVQVPQSYSVQSTAVPFGTEYGSAFQVYVSASGMSIIQHRIMMPRLRRLLDLLQQIALDPAHVERL